jgi:hypothetical protein
MRFLRGLYRFWIQAQSTPRTIQYGISFVVVLALALPALRPAAVRREAADMIFLGSVWMIVVHNVAYAAILPVARFSVQVWPEVAWLLAVGVGHLTTKPLSQGPAERPS